MLVWFISSRSFAFYLHSDQFFVLFLCVPNCAIRRCQIFICYRTTIFDSKNFQSEEIDEKFVQEIFQRLQLLDTNSIKQCLKIVVVLCIEHSQVRISTRRENWLICSKIFTTPMVLESFQRLAGLHCEKLHVDSIDIESNFQWVSRFFLRQEIFQLLLKLNDVCSIFSPEIQMFKNSTRQMVLPMRLLNELNKWISFNSMHRYDCSTCKYSVYLPRSIFIPGNIPTIRREENDFLLDNAYERHSMVLRIYWKLSIKLFSQKLNQSI